jgi:hypothetical protein
METDNSEEAIPVSVVATQFKELVRSAGKLLDEQDEKCTSGWQMLVAIMDACKELPVKYRRMFLGPVTELFNKTEKRLGLVDK